MKSIYDSGYHHPLAAYLGGLLLLALLARHLRKRPVPFFVAYSFVFAIEILADALVTGAWSPIAQTSAWFTPLSIAFVILGDLRVFVLTEYYRKETPDLGRALTVAVPVALLVPVITGVGRSFVSALTDSRVLFLVYELMLATILVFVRFVVLRTDGAPSTRRRFARRIADFTIVQYVGWALADIVILSGAEIGHLLRIVPNVLYYAGFLLFAYRVAPEEELRT